MSHFWYTSTKKGLTCNRDQASLKSNPPYLYREMDQSSEHPDGSGLQLRRFDFAGEDVCSVSERVVFVCCLLLRTMFMFMLG